MVKVACQVCGVQGYLQKVTDRFYRVRHYRGKNEETGKSKFTYHRIDTEFAERELAKFTPIQTDDHLNIGHLGNGIDLNLNSNGLDQQNKCFNTLNMHGTPFSGD